MALKRQSRLRDAEIVLQNIFTSTDGPRVLLGHDGGVLWYKSGGGSRHWLPEKTKTEINKTNSNEQTNEERWQMKNAQQGVE